MKLTGSFLVSVLALTRAEEEPACRTFEEIYGNGQNLCNNLWGDAFIYVPRGDPNYDLAYTMWFFEDVSPNDDTTQKRIAKGLHKDYNNTEDFCYLDYFHHDKPKKEDNGFSECHPWESHACCSKDIVNSAQTMKEAYGPEFHWDRCGPMAPECERFFVQESCFYECDANAGLFRRYSPVNYESNKDPKKNEWEMKGMPIKGDYCDAFYRACRTEKFCAKDNGDIFSCARVYESIDNQNEDGNGSSQLSSGIITLIVVLSLVVLAGCCVTGRLIMRERAGNPMFKAIEIEQSSRPSGQFDDFESNVART